MRHKMISFRFGPLNCLWNATSFDLKPETFRKPEIWGFFCLGGFVSSKCKSSEIFCFKRLFSALQRHHHCLDQGPKRPRARGLGLLNCSKNHYQVAMVHSMSHPSSFKYYDGIRITSNFHFAVFHFFEGFAAVSSRCQKPTCQKLQWSPWFCGRNPWAVSKNLRGVSQDSSVSLLTIRHKSTLNCTDKW